MKILVTGANGQLGNEMRKLSEEHAEHEYMFTDVGELDICDADKVDDYVSNHKPDVIVNCAAYTNVDGAESAEMQAARLNCEAVRNLARSACRHGSRMIHVSTDYVFDGRGFVPYEETSTPNPQTVYGRTKLAGEEVLMRENGSQSVVIRTAWLYSEYGKNFVKTMLSLGRERDELRVIYDQIGSPTYALDLAEAIYVVIGRMDEVEKGEPLPFAGVYHFTNEGVCSWYDFTKQIHRQAGVSCRVEPILSDEYAQVALRPHYSVLDKKKIKKTFGIEIRHWQDALESCIKELEK